MCGGQSKEWARYESWRKNTGSARKCTGHFGRAEGASARHLAFAFYPFTILPFTPPRQMCAGQSGLGRLHKFKLK